MFAVFRKILENVYISKYQCRSLLSLIDNFTGDHTFTTRRGGGHDVGKLATCFKYLGFAHDHNNDCKSDLSSDEMRTWCKKLAEKNYSDADCVVVAILTHGESPDLLQGSDGKFVKLDELQQPFLHKYNRSLIGKPKIFIIQACRSTPNAMNIGVKDRQITSGTVSFHYYKVLIDPYIISASRICARY